MKQSLRYIILVLASLLPFAGINADSIQASLDSVYIQMGRQTLLHLKVSRPANVKGELLLNKQLTERGIYPVCGDSVELRAPIAVDTVRQGNMLSLSYDIPVQSFDSGMYQLPELLYISGSDTLHSNRVALKVVPVKASANDTINDYASVSDPAEKSFFDFVPDWFLDYWWIILIVAVAICVFIWATRRVKQKGSLLPKKPEPTPYEKAVRDLKNLKAKGLWEKGLEKSYYTELTDIIRRYLSGRFGINAMEMTSRQILQRLGHDHQTAEQRPIVRQILDMADFVKFAKVRPLPDDNVLAFENAVKFVEQTKPAPEEENADSKIREGGKS
ncbi:MAG: YpfN family protein [Muribaculaceae bacterium]|nr:YpfN family protein [Muribaculaceae bacterium]